MLFNYEYDISIVMGYYNRKKQLINTLNDFEKKYKNYNYEVIIVDDNSTNENKLKDILNNYSYPINLIEISEEEKGNRINPCITYNKGFKEAKGKYVVIQNPECIHIGNILKYVLDNLTSDDYIAFPCYSCNSENLTNKLLNNISLINNQEFNYYNRSTLPWYNHSVYRPVHYHFCACIMNDNLKLLGGFNEEYSKGHSYDDNEILLSIKENLQLNIKTIDFDEKGCYVIHQWHSRDAESRFTQEEHINMFNINKKLYETQVEEHSKYNFNFPKLLQLYWDGSPLSYMNLLTILSFNKYHRGWKINVFCPIKRNENISWNTNEQKTKYVGIDYFYELKKILNVNIHYIDTDLLPFKYKDASEIIKSDYIRLYILNNYGGLWSDFDIIYTNNIERYYHNKNINNTKNIIIYRYKCGEDNKNVYPVGLLLSKKNNNILDVILNNIDKFYNKLNYQCLGTIMFENIFNNYNNDIILKNMLTSMKLSELLIDNADCYLKVKWDRLDIFYSSKYKHIKTSEFENNDNIFGIHWFNGADDSIHYCNSMDLDKIKNNDSECLIDKFVKKYI